MELGIVIGGASDAAARSGAANSGANGGVTTPANSETTARRAPAPAIDANTPRGGTAVVGGAGHEAARRPPPPQGSGRGQALDILV